MHPRQPLVTYVDYLLGASPADAVSAGLAELRSSGGDLAVFYDTILAPAARRVGDLWHSGDINVADEHAATATIRRTMLAAKEAVGVAEARDRLVVLACPEREAHEIGLQMFADVLEADGFEVRVLGADTPADDTAQYAVAHGAAAVALTCATPIGIVGLTRSLSALRGADPELPVLVGGRCLELYPSVLPRDSAPPIVVTTRGGRDEIRRLS